MARQVLVTMVSDLSGKEGDVETIEFGLDGVGFEVDLTPGEAEKLRGVLEPYVLAGRRLGRNGKPRGSASSSVRVGPDPRTVREWARNAGKDIPARGRIPAAVVEEFELAMGAS